MASPGVPRCPVEGCDGDLYREFATGMNQSTAQLMRWAGWGLVVGPVIFGVPFLLDYLGGAAGLGGILGAVVAVVLPMGVGAVLLRRRKQGLSVRSEQRRCNKCGTVVPP